MNKLTLLLAALAVCASSSDLQAQKPGSRGSLTVKQVRNESGARRNGTAARPQTARASKPVIVEDVQGRRTLASGGTGVVRNLPSDRPVVGSTGGTVFPYPGRSTGAGPAFPTKPGIRPYRPRTTYTSPYIYGGTYGSYYPSYYASIYNYSYSPYYYTSGYGYSPYYTGYYPASYYSPYYDSYYGPYSYTAAYGSPYYYTGAYSPYTGTTGGTYAVSGLTGVGSYPVATYPEPIQTNVVDWTPEPAYTDSTRMEAVPPPPAASRINGRTQGEEMIEYERPIEK